MMKTTILVSELGDLIRLADKTQEGCTVELMSIYVPPIARGKVYGVVTWGRQPAKRVFHNEEELVEILTMLGS